MPRKPRILFVGAFAGVQKNGATGGVLYASMSLLASPISRFVEWRLVNSSLESLPPPPVWIRGLRALLRLFKVTWILGAERIDVVLLFSSAGPSLFEKGLTALLAKMWGKRVIFCPQSGLIKEHFRRRSWLAGFARRVFAWVDLVVCQGISWKLYFEDQTGVAADKFVVLQNWIDATPYVALPLSVEKPVLSVLFVGWIVPYKGVFDLIEAARQCLAKGLRMKFTLAGDGASLGEVQALIAQYDLGASVQLLGWAETEEKMRLLAEADIFVLPSHTEGMPNSLLEAMASGRACVATSVGGIPDLLNEPRLGRLIPPHSPSSLAAALGELAASYPLRRALGIAARNHILANNEIQTVYPRIYQILTGRELPAAMTTAGPIDLSPVPCECPVESSRTAN